MDLLLLVNANDIFPVRKILCSCGCSSMDSGRDFSTYMEFLYKFGEGFHQTIALKISFSKLEMHIHGDENAERNSHSHSRRRKRGTNTSRSPVDLHEHETSFFALPQHNCLSQLTKTSKWSINLSPTASVVCKSGPSIGLVKRTTSVCPDVVPLQIFLGNTIGIDAALSVRTQLDSPFSSAPLLLRGG